MSSQFGLLASYGITLTALEKSEEAEALLLEALAVRRKQVGEEDYPYAAVRGWLGRCIASQGRFEEGERELRPAYEQLFADPGDSSAQSESKRLCLENMIYLYDAWGKPNEAARYRAELAAFTSGAETTPK